MTDLTKIQEHVPTIQAFIDDCKNNTDLSYPRLKELRDNVSHGRRTAYDLANTYETMISTANKKKTGSYYTPSELTKSIIITALSPIEIRIPEIEDIHKFKICDIACGSGVFLLSAIDIISDLVSKKSNNHGVSLEDIKKEVALGCLYGVDLNEDAMHVARLCVWLHCGFQEPPFNFMKERIKCFDSVATPIAEFKDMFAESFVDKKGFDCIVGNPPFAGKNTILANMGADYIKKLQKQYTNAHGNSDLSAYFFRRAFDLLDEGGTFGLIATNTISQGDTRTTGLQYILREGKSGLIYDATRSMPWPGDASVAVSVVHIAKGIVVGTCKNSCILDQRPVKCINSRLRGKPERSDPLRLMANSELSYLGVKVYGVGFELTDKERCELIAKNKRNAELIRPYLGGKEINTSPTQTFERYVIRLGDMNLEEAEQWPDLIKIVREKVKPERDRLKNNPDGRRLKEYWWQFGRDRPALYDALRGLSRCLVNSRVSQHLIFAWQPTDRILSEALYVYPFEDNARFACLQSRVHEPWARLLSSSLEDRLRYTASDCFETFPFPPKERLTASSTVEKIGAQLDSDRAAYMGKTQQGLTKTYNQLKDPNCALLPIIALRKLHLELDRAVLEAYGWGDLSVPPFETPRTPEERAVLEAFEDEVIDRLFELNEKRAQDD